nr:PCYCGC motif-containing (lipo)protein [Peribacillus frigoritolerans]
MKISVQFFMTAFLAGSVFLTGCQETGSSEEKHDHGGHSSFKNNGDIQEETKSASVLPSFLNEQPDEIKTLYKAAAEHEELLSYMPCYCGCGESAGHNDNGNCFIKERKENGAIIWDDHGTKCGVCLEIAAKAIIEHEKGMSMKDVRDMIDEQYKEGYAEPTDTKVPEV